VNRAAELRGIDFVMAGEANVIGQLLGRGAMGAGEQKSEGEE
jgi:hypothetical protein